MSWDSSSTRHLSAEESASSDSYRAVSLLAVLAFLLGLASIAAYLSPFAWFLPFVAVVVGLVALRRIRLRSDVLVGAKLATAGIVLSLLFLSSAIANHFMVRSLLEREAKDYVQQWFQMLHDGDLNRAYQAALPLYKRQPEGTLLDEYYQREGEKAIDRDNFFSQRAYGEFVPLMRETTPQFDRLVDVVFDGKTAYVTLRYFLVRDNESDPAYHLQTTVSRDQTKDGIVWTVYGNADAKEVDERSKRKRR